MAVQAFDEDGDGAMDFDEFILFVQLNKLPIHGCVTDSSHTILATQCFSC